MIEINTPNEIEKYYNKDKNGYIFDDDVTIKCDINVGTRNIYAKNIHANNLTAHDIWCNNMNVCHLEAYNIYSQKIETIGTIKVKNTFSATVCICSYLESSHIRIVKLTCSGVKATKLIADEVYAEGVFVSDLQIWIKIGAHTIGKKSQAFFKIH